ncbi:hypothetical protein [Nocardia huaxiensis]|uniref:hypothetical protein n=1 Tax=Nocardia huaxiensis TaxID=2755382 RepID=UPI001E48FA82|nr:hypothetical protein [Nocardia huaxiensis]UFS99072.1 hypothetical protein LPY97_14820 [Nocardia huaxiensis]
MRSRLPAAIHDATEWVRRFARTAPGAIGAVGVALMALCILSGLICANQLSTKQTRRDTVLEHTEPLAYAAQRLYVALSTADAAATTAFLSGGIESKDVRTRYEESLTAAAAALAEATTGATDSRTREILATISAELPTYAGLVEAARANNRQNLPVGAAYLRQASALMQNTVLPNAGELQTIRIDQLRDEQRAIESTPLLSVTLLLLTLAGCGYASLVLLRRTNRRFNLGVGFAAGASLLALLWIAGATLAATTAIDTGRDGATARFEALAQSRILAQQARTEETLQLITRSNIDESDTRFGDRTTELRDTLKSVIGSDSPAAQAITNWTDGHRTQVTAYRGNDYRAAVAQSIGTGAGTSATAFAGLDDALAAEFEDERTLLRDGVDAGGDALILSPFGTLVLLFAAAGAVGAGLWPRLKEFL